MIEAVAVGLVAGVVSGMFGVGGGVVFVPGLVLFFGFGQVEAEATSLLAIVPVALVGAQRQRRYGNIRTREGVAMGFLAAAGAGAGVVAANALPVRALEIAFAALMVVSAVQLARHALSAEAEPTG
jgi:uncharacterized membrane protein YfcA